MNNIYELESNFEWKIRDKYVWGEVIFESKYKPQIPDGRIESDYFHHDYYMKIWLQTWKYWWDILFIWIDFLIKKDLHEKLVKNWFIRWYKTYKVINTEKWWPEYVGLFVDWEWWKASEEYIEYKKMSFWDVVTNFKWYDGINNWNDFFWIENIPWKFISEKLYNFLQQNADVWNVEFKKIECI